MSHFKNYFFNYKIFLLVGFFVFIFLFNRWAKNEIEDKKVVNPITPVQPTVSSSPDLNVLKNSVLPEIKKSPDPSLEKTDRKTESKNDDKEIIYELPITNQILVQ